jgi:hypothetical protein
MHHGGRSGGTSNCDAFAQESANVQQTFTQGFGPLALAPMFPAYIKEFDSDLAGVVQFTGICILVLGFSNFIW